MAIFSKVAKLYFDIGLSPIPLGKPTWEANHAKAAYVKNWQNFARDRYDEETLNQWIDKFTDHNIGIGLGTIIEPGWQIVAIDIDQDLIIERVEAAIGKNNLICGKIGAKGITWFILVPEDLKTKAIRYRPDPKKKPEGTAIDFLAFGRQTVIPPSIHPDTKQPYKWVGKPLHELGLKNLPKVNRGAVIEMEAVSCGADKYFNGGAIEDGTIISGINNMTWKGVGGGGDTYDSRLRAIAHMVSTGWTDDDIIERINRSQRESVERSGEVFNWNDCDKETKRLIEDARKKGFDSGTKKKDKKPVERVMAEWLIALHDHMLSNSGACYVYDQGHYVEVSDDLLISLVVNHYDKATANLAAAATSTAKAIVFKDNFGSNAKDKICLLNGTLEISSGLLRPWSPDDEILHQIPIEWNPDAECPMYDEFIKSVFGDDDVAIDCFDEFAGLSLVDDMSFQKTMFILGEGANGKSTLINLLIATHADTSISNVPITQLNDERKVTSLIGKLLNVTTEQTRMDAIATSEFKQIVGGDPIVIRKLYSEAENNVKLKVRFLCSMNELPIANDASEAMKRRLIILNCPNVIPEEQRDPNLLDKLKTELPGALRRWVSALHRLRQRGKFNEPTSSRLMVSQYIVENDPVKVWMKQRIVLDEKSITASEEAYSDFVEWAKLNGYIRPLNSVLWGRRMDALESIKSRISEIALPDGHKIKAYRFKIITSVSSSRIANRV